jgi:hypothetical protein
MPTITVTRADRGRTIASNSTLTVIRFATAVVHNERDMSEAQRQLQHAQQQLDLAGQHRGRKAG